MEDKNSRKKFKSERDSKNDLKEIKVKKCVKVLNSKSDLHINKFGSVYKATSTSYSSDNQTSNQASITVNNIKTEISDIDEDEICKDNLIHEWKPNEYPFSDKSTLLIN